MELQGLMYALNIHRMNITIVFNFHVKHKAKDSGFKRHKFKPYEPFIVEMINTLNFHWNTKFLYASVWRFISQPDAKDGLAEIIPIIEKIFVPNDLSTFKL